MVAKKEPSNIINLPLTLQEANALIRVVGDADTKGLIDRDNKRPIDWVMTRLVNLTHELIEKKIGQ